MGFILVGKVLGKIFRILGLNEWKGRWVAGWNKIFMEIFGSMLQGFLPLSLVSILD